MSEQLKQLQDLQSLLHEINQEFAKVAQPLYRMTDPDDHQRKQIGDRLRAVEARWESVTHQISQVLGTGSTPGTSYQSTTKADRDEN